MYITSIKDPLVLKARELLSSKGRKQAKKCLLFGAEQIQWAVRANIQIEAIFKLDDQGLSEIPDVSKEIIHNCSQGILKKISNTSYLIPFMAIARWPNPCSLGSDFIVVLDQLQDFGNIGSIVRTSQGFSIGEFAFVNMQSDPFSRKIVDSSRGQVFNGHFESFKSERLAIERLRENGYQIVVTSPHAPKLQSQVKLSTQKMALVIGNESNGVSDAFLKAADLTIQIPMNPFVESLNVSVSAGISIYELKFKQVLMMLKERIFANLGRQVGVTGKLIRAAFDKEISKVTDLSGLQVITLMILSLDETMTLEQISRDTALFGEELNAFIGPLEDKYLLNRSGREYTLTEQGSQFLAEIWPVVERTHQAITSNLNAQEISQLQELLERVQRGCQAVLDSKSFL